MAKDKVVFACTACGFETPRWAGKCPGCGAWNTLEETVAAVQPAGAAAKTPKQRPGTGSAALLLDDIPEDTTLRTTTGIDELEAML